MFKDFQTSRGNTVKHPNNNSKHFISLCFARLKPGPAVMELHGRQSLTKRMLVFQQFMDSNLSHGLGHGMAGAAASLV